LTDSPAQTSPPVTRTRERVKLDRDESRHARRNARWVLRGLLSLAILVATLSGGGTSWTAVFAVWVLLAAAVPAAVIAVPNKPPRILLGLLWLGLGVVTALQLLPLPRTVVGLLAPKALELSDLGHAALSLPNAAFLPLAIAPGEAAFQGAVYLLGACLALLGSIALSGHDGRRAIHWTSNIVMAAGFTSGLAWVSSHTAPITDFVPGGLSHRLSYICFVNPNNEAGLLNLCVAMALSRMRLAINPRWQTVFGLMALFPAMVVLEVGSRGGQLTLALVLTMTVFMRPGFVKGRRVDVRDVQRAALIRTAVLVASLALVGAIIAWPAIENEWAAGSDSHKGATMAQMIGVKGGKLGASMLLHDTWRIGAAPGGLPVLAGLDTHWGDKRFDFAENFILDNVFSFGFVFGLAFLLTLAWALIDIARRRADIPQAPGFIIACVTMIVANFVDFSLQLAGGLLPFLALGTALERALGPRGGRDNLEEKRLPTFRRVLVVAIFGLALAGGMLAKSFNAMARNAEGVLQDADAQSIKHIVAARFLNDHHAFYVYGRKRFDAHANKEAAAAFDRAVALRPGSAHAHLFRFAAHLELGDAKVAADDLRWLLDQDDDIVRRAMRLCMDSRAAEAVLVTAIPRGRDQSMRVAEFLGEKRPELVERVALALRESQPKRVFAIELARGQLYIRQGLLEPARRIAANLLANKETLLLGYLLEAELLERDKKYYQAFHLYREVCAKTPDSMQACNRAITAIINANRPDEALVFVNSRAPYLQSYTSHAAFFWFSKGRIALQLNRQEDALEAFRRAHGFQPESDEMTIYLADTCIGLGLRDEARSLLEELLVKTPNLPSALKLSKDLDRDAHNAIGVAPATAPTPSILEP
jgi:tetratricopeptide (TPR) repeat protein